MGYSTNFSGVIRLSRSLTVAEKNYLDKFAETRRMKRDAKKTALRKDPTREAVKLPVGKEGGYFVDEGGFLGQDRGSDVLDGNRPPKGQPEMWCQWKPTEDGQGIEWDGGDKFYGYVKWMEYIIENFLKRWNIVANGEIVWQGDDSDDIGKIVVKNNKVTTKEGHIEYD